MPKQSELSIERFTTSMLRPTAQYVSFARKLWMKPTSRRERSLVIRYSPRSQDSVISWNGLLCRYFPPQVEKQIRRRRCDAKLADHANNLATMQRRMVNDMLHLIDEPHGIVVAAKKIKGEFSAKSCFI